MSVVHTICMPTYCYWVWSLFLRYALHQFPASSYHPPSLPYSPSTLCAAIFINPNILVFLPHILPLPLLSRFLSLNLAVKHLHSCLPAWLPACFLSNCLPTYLAVCTSVSINLPHTDTHTYECSFVHKPK